MPYTKVDSSTFERLDGADDAIFNWLTSTQQSLALSLRFFRRRQILDHGGICLAKAF